MLLHSHIEVLLSICNYDIFPSQKGQYIATYLLDKRSFVLAIY